jgi:lipopolysaccharide transport system ATP-binding protein
MESSEVMAIEVRDLAKQYTRGPEDGGFHNMLSALARKLRRQSAVAAGTEAFWALEDVSFAIRHGERVGIIGRNGAGKSTLLKILSRVVYPTRGEARVRGRLTSLLEVGTGFNENLTGRENVYINAAIHGLRPRETTARLESIIDFSEIRPFIDTPVKRYSSGMKMRLAFSVVAHLEPDILLLDEVFAVGDMAFQKKCLDHVTRLVAEGRTFLFVSHGPETVIRLCDRCIWLDGGRVRRDGPARDVVAEYLAES